MEVGAHTLLESGWVGLWCCGVAQHLPLGGTSIAPGPPPPAAPSTCCLSSRTTPARPTRWSPPTPLCGEAPARQQFSRGHVLAGNQGNHLRSSAWPNLKPLAFATPVSTFFSGKRQTVRRTGHPPLQDPQGLMTRPPDWLREPRRGHPPSPSRPSPPSRRPTLPSGRGPVCPMSLAPEAQRHPCPVLEPVCSGDLFSWCLVRATFAPLSQRLPQINRHNQNDGSRPAMLRASEQRSGTPNCFFMSKCRWKPGVKW